MILDTINNWLTKHKPYFFGYSNGFFKFYYFANSPELMVNTIKKMPTVTCEQKSNIIYLNNTFLKSSLRYIELEKGLWLLNSKIYYKNNIMYEAIYDASLPADYYCLTINLIQNEYISEFYKFGKHTISNYSINILKPLKEASNFHFKGANEVQYVLYFSEQWMQENIIEGQNTPENLINFIHDQDEGFLTFSISKSVFDSVLSQFEVLFNDEVTLDKFKIKLQTYQFFELFFANFLTLQSIFPDRISGKNMALLEKIENYLMSHVYGKFPGIEMLSNHFAVSPTKLKNDFKTLYGTSVFSYFQKKQMELAYQILANEDTTAPQVAAMFGYENIRKFSITFKKINAVMPSKVNLR